MLKCMTGITLFLKHKYIKQKCHLKSSIVWHLSREYNVLTNSKQTELMDLDKVSVYCH